VNTILQPTILQPTVLQPQIVLSKNTANNNNADNTKETNQNTNQDSITLNFDACSIQSHDSKTKIDSNETENEIETTLPSSPPITTNKTDEKVKNSIDSLLLDIFHNNNNNKSKVKDQSNSKSESSRTNSPSIELDKLSKSASELIKNNHIFKSSSNNNTDLMSDKKCESNNEYISFTSYFRKNK
jgi:hypothetical protein